MYVCVCEMLKEHSKSDLHQHTIGDYLLYVGERGVPHHHVAGRNSAKRSCRRGLYFIIIILLYNIYFILILYLHIGYNCRL